MEESIGELLLEHPDGHLWSVPVLIAVVNLNDSVLAMGFYEQAFNAEAFVVGLQNIDDAQHLASRLVTFQQDLLSRNPCRVDPGPYMLQGLPKNAVVRPGYVSFNIAAVKQS